MVFILLFISFNLLGKSKNNRIVILQNSTQSCNQQDDQKHSQTRNEPYTISGRSVTHKHRSDSVFVAQSFTLDIPNPEGIG